MRQRCGRLGGNHDRERARFNSRPIFSVLWERRPVRSGGRGDLTRKTAAVHQRPLLRLPDVVTHNGKRGTCGSVQIGL